MPTRTHRAKRGVCRLSGRGWAALVLCALGLALAGALSAAPSKAADAQGQNPNQDTIAMIGAGNVGQQLGRLWAADGDQGCAGLYDDLPKSTASYHFRMLREAGVIEQYDQGGRRLNRLRRDELEEENPGLLVAVFGPSVDPAGAAHAAPPE